MNRTHWLKLAVPAAGLALGAALVMASLGGGPPAGAPSAETPPASDGERGHRMFERMMSGPRGGARGLDEAAAPPSRATDEPDGEPGRDLRAELRAQRVGEEDARAYFEEHRALFGDRSFAESRFTVERLVAIERVQETVE